MSDVAYVCRFCGWEVTFAGLDENGGDPYCCGSAERGQQ